MTITLPGTSTNPSTIPHSAAPSGVGFLELEIGTYCQLSCSHCYSHSSPLGGTGTMTVPDWENVIGQAAGLGIETVQFIGGEPTLYEPLPHLVRCALGYGLQVAVYTNLVHVTDALWELFALPGVRLGTSWYSKDPAKHGEVTGSTGAHARTRANIIKALQLGIGVQAGIVEVVPGQDVDGAKAELLALGITDIQIDRARPIGRAAPAERDPQVSDLCGNCGRGRAAITADGQLVPCVLGRFLPIGDVRVEALADLLTSARWSDTVASVPLKNSCGTCTPADSNDCDPSR